VNKSKNMGRACSTYWGLVGKSDGKRVRFEDLGVDERTILKTDVQEIYQGAWNGFVWPG
jgi:hypothetical protein